jgi:hypothetical protein
MKKISWLLIPALFCGCSQDWSDGLDTARLTHDGMNAPDAASARMAPSSPAPSHSPRAFGSAPDRGALVAYGPDAPVRRAGAYTWHSAALSEEHALRAIATKELTFTAPDGTPIKVAYERHIEHPDGNWTWIGEVEGASGQSAVITFGETAAFGTIPQDNGELPLRLTVADGHPWVVSTDRKQLGEVHNEATDPGKPDYLVPPKRVASAASTDGLSTAGMATAGGQVMAAASNGTTVIDVLVGFSNGFASSRGGQSAAVTRVRNLVDITNDAYVRSQINAELRLVHSMQVNYPDNTDNGDALEKLTGFRAPSTPIDPDPAFSALRNAREQHGADLVVLVRKFQDPENDGCGIAWLLGGGMSGIVQSDEYFAYSVVSDGNDQGDDGKTYFCRDETFAHEVGHNLGSAHDAEAANNEPGAYAYSYGYKTTVSNGNFYTIMAYGDSGQASYRVFSNPNISEPCGGRACGTALADNARSHNQTVPIVSTFRATVGSPGPSGVAPYDFNGDGVSDILWRNASSGAGTIWLSANNTTTQAMATVSTQAWRIMGAGDFNGDGKSDILWRNSSDGRNTIWLSGSNATQQAITRVGNPAWKIAGVGDFDGDGKSDILWRNASNGGNTIWRSAQSATQIAMAPVNTQAWKIVGVGDFDGDGRSDVLWRHSDTGAGTIWRAGNNATQQSVTRVSNPAWKVVGVGDFNGDGWSDILWRNTSNGQNTIWRSGDSGMQQSMAHVPNQAWTVARVSDFNGDGRSDILWRNGSSGANTIWRSGDSTTQQAVATVANLAWVIQ